MAPDQNPPDANLNYHATGFGARLAPGQLIADKVEVIEYLGSGGMSDVYKCNDVTLSRVVAVKTLKAGFTADSLRRLQTEGRAVARLEHANIVKLYGLRVGVDDLPILVMEFVDGISLSALLEKEGALSASRSLKLASQIAEGLRAAHREGIIHRDLKPSNIMIVSAGSPQEKVKILDFGIAKIQNELSIRATQTGDVIGTPQYMSPEQAMGKKCDASSDQYSLGCVLFEMLCGHPPFQQDSTVAVLIAHAQEQVPPLKKAMKQGPSEKLQKLVATLLQKNATDRYESMREVSEAIVDASTMSGAHRARPMIATVGALLASVIVAALLMSHKEPQISGAATGAGGSDAQVSASTISQQSTSRFKISSSDEDILAHPEAHVRGGTLVVKEGLSDAGLKKLAGNQAFTLVSIRESSLVTADGVASLNPTRLIRLDLDGTGVDDKLAKYLGRFCNVIELILGDTTVGNITCREAAKLPHLLTLGLRNTKVDGRVLAYLAKVKTLEHLDLSITNVSGYLNLLKDSSVNDLDLSQVKLTASDIDDGITRMKGMRHLRLDDTTLSNKELQKFARLKNLDAISLVRCSNIDDADILEFHRRLPRCVISQDKGIEASQIAPNYDDIVVTGPDLLKNGDFENGSKPKSNVVCGRGSTYLSDWVINNDSIGWFNRSARVPASGNYSIELSAGSSGMLSQNIPTTAGCTYFVRLKVARAPDRTNSDSSKKQRFFIQTDHERIQYDVRLADVTNSKMNWTDYAWTFRAQRTITNFQIGSAPNNSNGPCIDAVSVYKVANDGKQKTK